MSSEKRTFPVVCYHFYNYYCKPHGKKSWFLFKTQEDFDNDNYCFVPRRSSCRLPERLEGQIVPPEYFHQQGKLFEEVEGSQATFPKRNISAEVDELFAKFQQLSTSEQHELFGKINSLLEAKPI